MNRIKILPENIAAKIAAGEVVQRPESVVKELIENAIDAGADSIEVIIRRAGKSLIQVCDNGTGMNEEDALLCFQKHATSKISKFDDLESISTLGFRGEALCSIAAVSQLEIKTETIEDEIGTLVRIENGTDIIKEKGSYSRGTCISVKNLFFNTPARRNFMKSDVTESKHIIDTFNKLALSHYDLSFKFFNDDQLIYNYTAGDLENRIKQVFADNMLEALIPVEERTDFMNVYGYIGKPAILKKSRGDQYIFLNSRYVISRQINHAVFTAYENFLEKGDYPFFVIFIDLDPRKTDVNVHPSKLEVRFDDERNVYNFILAVVKKGLGTYEPVTDIAFTRKDGNTDKQDTDISFNDRKENDAGIRNFKEKSSFTGISFSDQDIDRIFGTLPDYMISSGTGETAHPFQAEIFHETPGKQADTISEEPAFIIQLHNKYILSQIKSGLMVIDQHLAHERILYEKALKRMDADLPFSQQLLFSKRLKPDSESLDIIKEISPYLIKLGFAIKLSGRNTVVIEGVPEDVKQGTEEKILMELAGQFVINRRDRKLDTKENIAEAYSSKTAIKAGDRLSEKEMRLLIDQLFAASMPYVCPHGKPVVVKIPLDEFDRRFGRS